MEDVLAWYVAGPVFGLLVVALYAVSNQRLGVSGSYLHLGFALRGQPAEAWRLWFLAGLLAGAAAAAASRGQLAPSAYYGRLSEVVPAMLLPPVLVAGGLLIGYGARWAGGCTSGNGLAGCSTRSTGSLTATVTFFSTAVAVTWLVHWVTGGAL
ncbi:YeeE/YedE family protein [Egicoccus sp. AB-alg6-2]|uniref:YeeE/YedE family protein n=1 Tax=Egicoccus sp. AB-alg6-2 TaxID=3242692 RepID=UPI00359CED81